MGRRSRKRQRYEIMGENSMFIKGKLRALEEEATEDV